MWKKKNWKKAVCMVLGALCLMQIRPVEVYANEYWPDGPQIASPAVILMEMGTGAILYERESSQKSYPASTTKILTTLIALENSSMDEVVTFSNDAIDKTEGSGISRDYGEQMTMEECLYAIMLNSANECSYAVAEHVGGTVEKFVEMMNARAKELGCKNTNFANPHGLFDENHYTTPYDMAIIAREAYENETFRIITGTARYTIPPTNKHEEETPLQNHNEMLYPFKTMKYRYEYCTGGKTGYTDLARSSLVTFAEKDGMNLVCVVMSTESPSQWTDSISLFDYGFDNFQVLSIADNETKYDTAEAVTVGALNNNKAFVDIEKDAKIVLPKTTEFSEAASEIIYEAVSDNVVGSIAYTYAGHEVGKADIVKTGIEVQGYVFDNQQQVPNAGEEISNVRINPLMIILVVLALILLTMLGFLGKRFADNYYIMRHNMEVRKNRREQFRRVKEKKSRRRRWR